MADEKLSAKTVTLINNTLNPIVLKGADGKLVRVGRGQPVIVTPEVAAKHLRYFGFVDASKWIPPSSKEESQAKEIDALKAQLADLQKGKAPVSAPAAVADKDKKDPLKL